MLLALPILAAVTVIALLAIAAWGVLQAGLQTVVRQRGPVRRVAVPLLLLALLLPTVAQASPAPLPLRWRSSAAASGEGEISSRGASREGSSFGENRTSGFRLFLQVDPAGYQDSPNLYAGFGNDPVNNRDPTGRALIPEAKCEGGLSAGGLAHGVTTAVATVGGFLDWLRPGGHSWEEYQANIDHFRAVGVELYGCRSVVGAEVVGAVLIPGPDEAALATTLKARQLVQVAKVDDVVDVVRSADRTTETLRVTETLVKEKGALKEFDIDRYGNFNTSARRGDGLEGHEVLQNKWLEAQGLVPRRGTGAASRDNPAVALSEGLHDKVGAAQSKLGLWDQKALKSMSARQNIDLNVEAMRRAGVPDHVIGEIVKKAEEHARKLGKL